MADDVWVFGDSHWRVFFPFVNHGAAADNISHEQDGVRTIDSIANELSGSTMWGLLNPQSKHGARERILRTISGQMGVDNVGLVFGEVDARFHHDRYFENGHLSRGRILELLSRYSRFVIDELLGQKFVRKNVFIYHGFAYPNMGGTLLQPGQPIGGEGFKRAMQVNEEVNRLLPIAMNDRRITLILQDGRMNGDLWRRMVSADGVHLEPSAIYPYVLDAMRNTLTPPDKREIPF